MNFGSSQVHQGLNLELARLVMAKPSRTLSMSTQAFKQSHIAWPVQGRVHKANYVITRVPHRPQIGTERGVGAGTLYFIARNERYLPVCEEARAWTPASRSARAGTWWRRGDSQQPQTRLARNSCQSDAAPAAPPWALPRTLQRLLVAHRLPDKE